MNLTRKTLAGISQFLDCSFGFFGQQRNVELEVTNMVRSVPRQANLSQSLEQREKLVH